MPSAWTNTAGVPGFLVAAKTVSISADVKDVCAARSYLGWSGGARCAVGECLVGLSNNVWLGTQAQTVRSNPVNREIIPSDAIHCNGVRS